MFKQQSYLLFDTIHMYKVSLFISLYIKDKIMISYP